MTDTPDLIVSEDVTRRLYDALEQMSLDCTFDVLNPCWDGRADDIPGKHWGGGEACPQCTCRAFLRLARKDTEGGLSAEASAKEDAS